MTAPARARTPLKQCKTCPWRVGARPERDIPAGYSVKKHRALAQTIADGTATLQLGALRVMACHCSPVGAERPCAGWLNHQVGVGNNIGARLAVMTGRMPPPEADGPQHARFEDTLPQAAARRRR